MFVAVFAAIEPLAAFEGVSLQPMISNPDMEILLGAKRDEKFGPVMLFGMGGIYAEILDDSALGLPPLNQTLARQLMAETRVFRIMQGYRNRPPADIQSIEQMIIGLSNLLVDVPEIMELDMNPVIMKNGRPLAVDARVIVEESQHAFPRHLAVSPYPVEYESKEVSKDGIGLFVRPIKPEDAPLLLELFDNMSMESRYYRFLSPKRELSKELLVRLTQVDYDRHIALVALRKEAEKEKMIGVVRIISDPDRQRAEFSVVVADDWQGQGIGQILLEKSLHVAADYKIQEVQGVVHAENQQMLGLGRKLGFKVSRDANSGEYLLTIKLEGSREKTENDR